MEHRVAAMVVAGAIAGSFGIGVISLASAQSTSTTPSTTTTTTTTPPTRGDNDPNCSHTDRTPGTTRSTTDQTYGDPT